MLVALGVAALDRCDVDRRLDRGLLRVVGDHDRAAVDREPASDLAHHEVAAGEGHAGVAGVDRVGPGRPGVLRSWSRLLAIVLLPLRRRAGVSLRSSCSRNVCDATISRDDCERKYCPIGVHWSDGGRHAPGTPAHGRLALRERDDGRGAPCSTRRPACSATLDQELQAGARAVARRVRGARDRLRARRARCLRMQELAATLHLSPSGVTRRIDGMVRRGSRRARPVLRPTVAAPTSCSPMTGREPLEAAAPTHVRGVRAHFVDRLSERQLANIANALSKIDVDRPSRGRRLRQHLARRVQFACVGLTPVPTTRRVRRARARSWLRCHSVTSSMSTPLRVEDLVRLERERRGSRSSRGTRPKRPSAVLCPEFAGRWNTPDELLDPAGDAELLQELTRERLLGRFVRVDPARDESPTTVVGPLDQQDAIVVVEDRAVGADLGGDVPDVGAEAVPDLLGRRGRKRPRTLAPRSRAAARSAPDRTDPRRSAGRYARSPGSRRAA